MKLPLSWWREKNSTVYFSGQVGLYGGKLVPGGFEAELRQAFNNLWALFDEANLTPDEIVRVVVYLVNPADYPRLNDIFTEMFREPFPVRTTVFPAGLPLGAAVEIEVTAERG